jgi:hypothetical protein
LSVGRSYLPGDLQVAGRIMCGSFTPPADCVTNNTVAADAGIEASKVIHQAPIRYEQAVGTAVVAETRGLFIARSSGEIVDFEAAIIGAIATDVSRTISIDVKKSTGEGAFATILSATLDFSSSSVLRRNYPATVSAVSYIDGDIFEVVVTVAGGSGSQAQGLLCTLTRWELPS